jgi:enamine deaminase RidA (YjgF/YER057c/UK114 family)
MSNYFRRLVPSITRSCSRYAHPLAVAFGGAIYSTTSSDCKSEKSIHRVNTTKRMSDLVEYNGTLYVAFVPETPHAPIQQQVKECLADLEATLRDNGSDKRRVLMVQVFLTDMERDYEGFNEAWDEFWPEGCSPVRATVSTHKLAVHGWKVEMVCTAATN